MGDVEGDGPLSYKREEQARTYENRRRMSGSRGKRPQKIRSELAQRTFAHLYETGAMRRVYLRGRDSILKRLLIHGAAFCQYRLKIPHSAGRKIHHRPEIVVYKFSRSTENGTGW